MAAGRRRAACRASPATSAAPKPCAARVNGAAELGIDYLTLYGFSSENWKRPPAEVDDLMGLLRLYLDNEIEELHRNGVRLRVIGQREPPAPDIVQLIDDAERLTAGNRKLNLTVALSYGGRAEIAERRPPHRRGGARRAARSRRDRRGPVRALSSDRRTFPIPIS